MRWKTGPHRFLQKPRKPEKPVGFLYKVQFSKFEGKNLKPLGFLKKRLVFSVYWSVFDRFFIQNSKFEWKMINRSIFPVYRSVFSSLSPGLFSFQFFKKNQNFKNFKLNWPVFSELTKPVQAGFIDFHKNQPVFVDIVIHARNCKSATSEGYKAQSYNFEII
jgi:hypothetical protein